MLICIICGVNSTFCSLVAMRRHWTCHPSLCYSVTHSWPLRSYAVLDCWWNLIFSSFLFVKHWLRTFRISGYAELLVWGCFLLRQKPNLVSFSSSCWENGSTYVNHELNFCVTTLGLVDVLWSEWSIHPYSSKPWNLLNIFCCTCLG